MTYLRDRYDREAIIRKGPDFGVDPDLRKMEEEIEMKIRVEVWVY